MAILAKQHENSFDFGLLGCQEHDPETEYITVKQEHTYVANGFPDIGPDPLDTTDHRGNERNQTHVVYQQYYYADEIPQGKGNITRFKPEPPNDPD